MDRTWVTARYEDGQVSASVRRQTEYDDGKHVTSEVAVTDDALLAPLGAALAGLAEATERALARRARRDAATMLLTLEDDDALALGGELGLAGAVASQKKGGA